MTSESNDQGEPTPDDFEKLVGALLRVDPEGITGQRAKKKDDENEEGPAD